MKRWITIIAAVVIVLIALRTSILFVDQAEYVYVTQFGAHVATHDGATDAGWHWKLPWPVQSTLRLDRRLQIFDVPTQELLIRDRDEKTGTDKPLPLTFDLYVCWRIDDTAPGQTKEGSDEGGVDPVDRFVRSFGTLEKAESFLRSQIVSRLKVELSDMLLAELINTSPGKLKTEELLERIRTCPPSGAPEGQDALSLNRRAQQVGIQIVDIRLRRFNHPLQVRDEIFAKIREQRKREANNYRLQGEELAATIRAEGELEARRIRADAESEKRRLEGRAQAESLRILNDAHKEAPEFYRIVRMLESYKTMFGDDKTQLILSLDHPLLALFKDLPRLNGNSAKPAGAPPVGKSDGEKK
jgi:modulator of FtsH protease HflC